jgi:hypothetical protein
MTKIELYEIKYRLWSKITQKTLNIELPEFKKQLILCHSKT